MTIKCNVCGQPTSTEVPNGTVVRAFVECPECSTKDQDNNITAYLERQRVWSKRTFGPGKRTKGIIDHITKELHEIAASLEDLSEWIDVVILAMDGYWRHGGTPEQFMQDMQAKQNKNFARQWPAPESEDVAVEHIREKL